VHTYMLLVINILHTGTVHSVCTGSAKQYFKGEYFQHCDIALVKCNITFIPNSWASVAQLVELHTKCINFDAKINCGLPYLFQEYIF